MERFWTWAVPRLGLPEEQGEGEGEVVRTPNEPGADYLAQSESSQHTAFRIFLDMDSSADFVFHTDTGERAKWSLRYAAMHPKRLPSAIH